MDVIVAVVCFCKVNLLEMVEKQTDGKKTTRVFKSNTHYYLAHRL
jgi:hypothetical protein